MLKIVFARPLLSFATTSICAYETISWLYRATPPAYGDWLPWIVHILGVGLTLLGLALMRAACKRTAKAERDYVIRDLIHLHQQSGAVEAPRSDQPEPTAELITTIRSARR